MARQPPPKPPNAESLALAASLWTSQISSWIPASFGASSSATKLPDLADVLERAGDEDDRLGMGHPALGKPKMRTPGLKELEKRMLGKAKGKARENAEVDLSTSRDESDGEEESRGRLGAKKRKNTTLDLLGGKKAKLARGIVGGASSGQSSRAPSEPASQPDSRAEKTREITSEEDPPLFSPQPIPEGTPQTPPRNTATSSPGGSGVFPFEGPVALGSPSAQRILSERKERLDLAREGTSTDDDLGVSSSPIKQPDSASMQQEEGKDGGGMSKSAQRRARRKALKEHKSRGV